MMANGATTSEVAVKFGVSKKVISDACAEHGICLRDNRAQPPGPNGFAVLRALLAKESPTLIAKRLGISRQRVYVIRDKAIAGGFTELAPRTTP